MNLSEVFKMADVMQELCGYGKRRDNIELKKTLGKILLHAQKSHKDCVGLDVKSQKKSRVRRR